MTIGNLHKRIPIDKCKWCHRQIDHTEGFWVHADDRSVMCGTEAEPDEPANPVVLEGDMR